MSEWSELVKNAIVALVILLAISVVFALAYLGLNAATRGTEKLASSTSAMDQRSFDPYNQTTISGTAVLSGIKNFQNQPIAYIVKTNRTPSANTTNYCALLADPPTDTGGTAAFKNNDCDFDNMKLKPIAGATGDVATGNAVERLNTGLVLFAETQNLSTTSATTKSNIRYINPTAKFKSVLIYDSNDEVVGVYCEQMVTNGVTAAATNLLQGSAASPVAP